MTIPPNLFPANLTQESDAKAAADEIKKQKDLLLAVNHKVTLKIRELSILSLRLGSMEPDENALRVWSEHEDLTQEQATIAKIFEHNCNEYAKRGGNLSILHEIAGVRLKLDKRRTS